MTTTSKTLKTTVKMGTSTSKAKKTTATGTTSSTTGGAAKTVTCGATTTKTRKQDVGGFPQDTLNGWLQNRYHWTHNDWLGLLSDLKKQGFGNLADSAEGQSQIGQYLEQNRWR